MKKFFNFFAFTILIFIISGCNFKRFEQKKYFCETNKLDIELIDILETRSIKKSYLTIEGKEYAAKITGITDVEINLILNDINIKIKFRRHLFNKSNAIKITINSMNAFTTSRGKFKSNITSSRE